MAPFTTLLDPVLRHRTFDWLVFTLRNSILIRTLLIHAHYASKFLPQPAGIYRRFEHKQGYRECDLRSTRPRHLADDRLKIENVGGECGYRPLKLGQQ